MPLLAYLLYIKDIAGYVIYIDKIFLKCVVSIFFFILHLFKRKQLPENVQTNQDVVNINDCVPLVSEMTAIYVYVAGS